MFDMFIGGVSAAGESSVQTLIRELQEEVGIDLMHTENFENTAAAYLKNADTTSKINFVKKLLRDSDVSESKQKEIEYMSKDITDSKSFSVGNTIKFLGRTKCYTGYNHCLVDVFAVKLLDTTIADMAFKDGEVQFGEWLTLVELRNRLLQGGRDKFVPDGLQVWDDLQESLLL
jgi:8-oxo-dGTP pyrophosphatase MutT (NUDIX family)